MAGEVQALRVIEIHAGDTIFYVYAEGVHIAIGDAEADIGPKGMTALVNAWHKLYSDEQEGERHGG